MDTLPYVVGMVVGISFMSFKKNKIIYIRDAFDWRENDLGLGNYFRSHVW